MFLLLIRQILRDLQKHMTVDQAGVAHVKSERDASGLAMSHDDPLLIPILERIKRNFAINPYQTESPNVIILHIYFYIKFRS